MAKNIPAGLERSSWHAGFRLLVHMAIMCRSSTTLCSTNEHIGGSRVRNGVVAGGRRPPSPRSSPRWFRPAAMTGILTISTA